MAIRTEDKNWIGFIDPLGTSGESLGREIGVDCGVDTMRLMES